MASCKRIVFDDGEALPRRGLFFNTDQFQHSQLPAMLGCKTTDKGGIEVNALEMTSIGGVYVVGDASRDVQLAIVAAAEGAKAAFAINKAFVEEEFV